MEQSSFFNAVINNGIPDRVYKAEGFARFFSSFIGNGVFPNPATNLNVIGLNNNMTITVKEGKAWINGYFYENTDDLILDISNADGVLNRIDRVVIRLDFLNREIKTYVKKGSFATNPIAPSIQRDADIYELAIADIRVNAGTINITQANITDLRLNKELCGIVTGTIEEIDTTTLYNQLKAHIEENSLDMSNWIKEAKKYFSNWLENTQSQYNNEFNTWFDTVKGILSEDAAGNLLNKINALEDIVNNLELVASNVTMSDGSTVEDTVKENKTSILELEKTDGKLANLQTTNKTNLVAAINEVFQNANNGKDIIANAIGSPLVNSDTFSVMGTKIDTLTQTFQNTLTEKGVEVLPSDKMSSLIDKVGNLVNIPGVPSWADVGNFWFKGIDSSIDRYRCGCATVGDELYIIGGYNGSKLQNNTSYNLKTNTFTEKEPMPVGKESMAISVVGTNIFIFGGTYDKQACYKYDTISGTWSTILNLPRGTDNCCGSSIGTNIFIFGGYTGTSSPVKANYMYDTLSNTYTIKADMQIALARAMCESYNDNIYVFGGYGGNSYSSYNQKYDTLSDTWSFCAQTGIYVADSASCVIDNYIYLAGGTTPSGKTNIVKRYNISKDMWENCANIPKSISYPSGKNIGGVFVLTNGTSDNPNYNKSTYCYVPKVQ